RFEVSLRPIDVLRGIGTYVALSVDLKREPDRLEPVFRFLNRLAVSPDREVPDLLVGAVFPTLAKWATTIELSRRMLIGKGRAGFEDALALWGPPPLDERILTVDTLPDAFRCFAPEFTPPPGGPLAETAAAFGQHLIVWIMAGTSDEALADRFRLLS